MSRLWKAVGVVVVVCAFLLWPENGLAQQASIVGTIVDESKAVLPGVTVTVTQVDTGRQFMNISNENGGYRMVGLPAGRYDVQADLPGFAATVLKGIELLVGQNATVPLTMKVATLDQAVTVSEETPLLDTQQAQVAGNVDTRQMQDIPIAGRNWQQLATLVKGITANTITTRPGVAQDSAFLLNLDGQNITNAASLSNFFGQPLINRDAIAEYQIVTNLFDVTMGQSTGVQVQAISKSGTNTLHGSLYGYFRDSNLNAADKYTQQVLPYENQQVGGTVGGPIIKDKAMYFLSYEGERSPNTIILTPAALPGQLFRLPTETDLRKPLAKFDFQLSPKDHLSVRWGYSRSFNNNSTSSVPSAAISQLFSSNFITASWSRASSTSLLQEFKLNYFYYHWKYAAADFVPSSISTTQTYAFPGLSLGTPSNGLQTWSEAFISPRYDLAWHKGKHDIKIGAESRLGKDYGAYYKGLRGTLRFSRLPSDAGTRFPASAALDPTQWNFTGLDSTATQFEITYARDPSFNVPRPMISGWIGDNWKALSKLSFNFGVRYDVAWRDLDPPRVTPTSIPITTGYAPFGTQDVGFKNGIRDLRDVAPRFGLAWNPRSDLVIHGGTGLYFAGVGEQPTDHQLYNSSNFVTMTFLNDGQPGWIADPTRGVTAAQVLGGRVTPPAQTPIIIAQDFKMPYSWQSAIGFQKQLTAFTGFDADLVYNSGRRLDSQRDPNLFYDPATGLNKNPLTFGRPNPAYGAIHLDESHGRSNYLALATSFTRKYHRNFQMGVTYTLMFYKNDTGQGSSGYSAMQLNTFNILTDWGRSADFQRNTLRLNGIWMLPKGFSMSAYWAFGSPNPSFQTTTNVDPLGISSTRVRRDLSIIPRNNYYSDNFQTLDLHLAKDVRLGERFRVTGVVELFNAYNYQQFRYNTLETSATFGQRNGTASPPRTGQLGVKLWF